jgi:hypothetical protein
MTGIPTVSIIHRGRTGTIRYSEPAGHSHDFECELGAGEVLLVIYAPSTDAWADCLPWAKERGPFLEALARQVIALECPGAYSIVHELGIDIVQPPGTKPVGQVAEGAR